MEHRRGLRYPLRLELELWQDEEKCGSYETSDISYGGLFIKGCHRKLSAGDFVTTKIKVRGIVKDISDKLELFPMRALAVHISGCGAGLMWADDNESFYRLLDEAVHMAARPG